MYEYDMDVRYRDVDPLKHVDHVEYVTYMQEARLACLNDRFDMAERGLDVIVVHVEVDYDAPVELGDDVTVGVSLSDPGTTSFRADYQIRANGDVAATGASVQLVADAETVEPVDLPDDWREAMG
jgi:acyl-CoA thioester hydrolase